MHTVKEECRKKDNWSTPARRVLKNGAGSVTQQAQNGGKIKE